MFDDVTASDRQEAVEKYKKKLLDQHADYEITIVQVCTKSPRVCFKD